MAQAFSPTEIFKRATASTLRAIAERDDLTVGFGPEPPGLSGSRVKLPNPARDLPPDAAALSRRCGAFEAGAGEPLGARRLRGAGTGPGRGLGRAPHGRGCRQPDRDARRAVSPPGFRA